MTEPKILTAKFQVTKQSADAPSPKNNKLKRLIGITICEKCVMVFNEELPLGIIANTAGILGITLGKYIPETVGPTVFDKDQYQHLGIITTPVPILKTNKKTKIKTNKQTKNQTDRSIELN